MTANIATLPTGKGQFSLAPQSLDEALRFAELLAKSSIVPKDYQGNPGNILVAVQWGAEIGLPPLQAMQNIAVINGRPSIWGDSMIALVRASGLLDAIKEDVSDTEAVCTVKRRGEEPVTRSFSKSDAERAGLLSKQGPWQQYPKRMMQMRARAYALRDVFPDVLRGVYVAEEAQDIPPERDVTAEGETLAERPKSRSEAVKKALADRRKESVTVPPLSVPAVGEVLEAISAAQTQEALKAAADLAKHLDDEGKKAAREAYRTRKSALESAHTVTFAQIADNLHKATSVEILDLAADLIGEIADEQQRKELSGIYHKRRAELTGE